MRQLLMAISEKDLDSALHTPDPQELHAIKFFGGSQPLLLCCL
jgi:hypothetical protein